LGKTTRNNLMINLNPTILIISNVNGQRILIKRQITGMDKTNKIKIYATHKRFSINIRTQINRK
jgi:hypothetical protein